MLNTQQTAFGVSNTAGSYDDHLVLRVFFDPQEFRAAGPFYMHMRGSTPAGRLLDAACSKADVQNNNHLERDESKRLILYTAKEERPLEAGTQLGTTCDQNDIVIICRGALPSRISDEIRAIKTEKNTKRAM